MPFPGSKLLAHTLTACAQDPNIEEVFVHVQVWIERRINDERRKDKGCRQDGEGRKGLGQSGKGSGRLESYIARLQKRMRDVRASKDASFAARRGMASRQHA